MTPAFAGSNPASPAWPFSHHLQGGISHIEKGPLAQAVEHLTFNQVVSGSSPEWLIWFSDLKPDGFKSFFIILENDMSKKKAKQQNKTIKTAVPAEIKAAVDNSDTEATETDETAELSETEITEAAPEENEGSVKEASSSWRSSLKTLFAKVFSKIFVFEKTKKTRNMLIFRAILFIGFCIFFFTNTNLYYTVKKNGNTTIYGGRIFGVIFISLLCIFIPVIKLKLPKRAVYTVQLASIVSTMYVAIWAGEHVFKYSWTENMKVAPIIFTMMIMFAIFTVFYLISNRQKLGVLSIYALTVLYAITNYYVYKFRGEAISAADVYTIGTAMNVIDDYTFKVTWEIYKVAFGIPILFSILTFLPAEHKRVSGWKRLFYIVPGTILVVWIFSFITTSQYLLDQGIKVKTFNMKTYKSNGEVLNFVRGFYYMRVVEPEKYSVKSMQKLIDESGYVSDSVDLDDGQVNPNVIFIMNEAMSDFSWYGTVAESLSEDPFEYIHGLEGQDNVILTKLDVDVHGGRTAITEYEALTGNSAAFAPDNAVPYSLYVKELLPSMTWNLRDLGYSGNMAFHPYKASGYSRPRAYPLIGFEDFISIEDIKDKMTDDDYIRTFISDKTDFNELINIYEETRKTSDSPFYMFNVTMQNHGGYVNDFDNFDQSIKVTGKLASYKDFKRFVNLMNYTDEAFEELTSYFEKVDEPTIIVMFGDHLPAIDSDAEKEIFGKGNGSMDAYEIFSYYRTPLVIWANYDINKDGKYNEMFENISVNYLSAVVMDIAGIPMTGYQKFLSDMHKVIPTITSHGYFDREGVVYELGDTTSPYYEEWIRRYNVFNYNNQFDDIENRINSFFMLKADSNAMLSGSQ